MSGRLDTYEGEMRAGALALSRIAHPDEPQLALPKEETASLAELLEGWLDLSPYGGLELCPEAEEPLKALLDGWWPPGSRAYS